MQRFTVFLCLILANALQAQAPTLPYTSLRVPGVEARYPVTAIFEATCYSSWQVGTQQINIAGNVVTLSLPIVNNPGGNICVDPPVRFPVNVSLGHFAPGNYTMVLQPLAPDPVQPGVDYSPISVPFVVIPDAPLYSDLSILTNPAIAGQPITAHIVARDFYAACFDGPLTDIQRVGNIITLTIRESDTNGCVIGVPPPGPQEFDVTIGSYPEGSYTLLVRTILDVSGGPTMPDLSANFSVLGAPISVPSTTFWGLALLVLAMLGLVARRMAQRLPST